MTVATDTKLDDFTVGPVDPLMLALYAGASGDHTKIHVDEGVAKSVGLPGVIGHGLLTMAFVGRAAKHWYGLRETRRLWVRFSAPVLLGDMLTVTGSIIDSRREGDRIVEELSIEVIATGERKVLSGGATVERAA